MSLNSCPRPSGEPGKDDESISSSQLSAAKYAASPTSSRRLRGLQWISLCLSLRADLLEEGA